MLYIYVLAIYTFFLLFSVKDGVNLDLLDFRWIIEYFTEQLSNLNLVKLPKFVLQFYLNFILIDFWKFHFPIKLGKLIGGIWWTLQFWQGFSQNYSWNYCWDLIFLMEIIVYEFLELIYDNPFFIWFNDLLILIFFKNSIY